MQEISSQQMSLSVNEFDIPLKCLICGFESNISLISHITRKHQITCVEYRKLFNVQVLQRATKQIIENNRNAQKKRLENPENLKKFLNWRSTPVEIKHWTKKGFSEEEAKQKISEFQSKISKKGNNPKTNELRRKKYSGDNNPMSLKSIADRHSVSITEASKLTPCHGLFGENHPFFGKKHTLDSLKKISSAHHLSKPSWRSKLEEDLAKYCMTLGSIECNFSIKQYNVDILFQHQKLIIEFFGDFWHMNPKKYAYDFIHPIMKKSTKEVNDRDSKKIESLEKLGYKVFVIWESEWRNNKEQIKENIKKMFFVILR